MAFDRVFELMNKLFIEIYKKQFNAELTQRYLEHGSSLLRDDLVLRFSKGKRMGDLITEKDATVVEFFNLV